MIQTTGVFLTIIMILFAKKTKLFCPTQLDTEEFQVVHMVLPPKVFHLKGQKRILR